MFRLVFLAFHGERRARTGARTPASSRTQHPAHGTSTLAPGTGARGTLHGHASSARCAAGDGVGADRAGARLDRRRLCRRAARARRRESSRAFLEPSFTVARPRRADARRPASRDGASAADGDDALELTLMGVSSAGRVRRHRHRDVLLPRRTAGRPTRLPRGSPACSALLPNKYYVDELYDAAIVQPIRIVSEEGLWKRVDVGVIDGSVNGVGAHRRRQQRAAAADADRFGPRLRRVAVARRRRDPGLLPLALRLPRLTRGSSRCPR